MKRRDFSKRIGLAVAGVYASLGVSFARPKVKTNKSHCKCCIEPEVIKSGWKDGEIEKLEKQLQDSAKHVWEEFVRDRYKNFS